VTISFAARRLARRIAFALGAVALAGAVLAPAVATANTPSVAPPIAPPPVVTQPIAPPKPGVASFVAQPGGGVAGVVWTVQPVVRLSGAAAGYRYYVSIALSGSGSGGLSCASTTVDMVSSGSTATGAFSGCTDSAPGTYSLHAAVSGKAASGAGVAPTVSANSASFTVTAAPVTGPPAPVQPIAPPAPGVASFARQPGGGAAGVAWASQPVVHMTHADPAYRYYAALAIDAAHSQGGGSLSCSSTEVSMSPSSGGTVVDGFFAGCSISAPGTYVLMAAVSGVATSGYGMTQPATTLSAPFYISGTAPAAGLWFTTQPLGAAAGVVPTGKSGQAWSIQPVVTIFATNGKAATTDNTTVVSLAIAGGTPASGGPGKLACTGGTSVKVQGGVARFSGCSMTGAGKGYALHALASTALAATSYPFDISSPNGYLAYTIPVLDTTPGAERVATSMDPWPFEPVVTVFLPDGKVATTNNSTTVTLAIDPPSTSGAVLQCSSGTAVVAVDGVATFSGCAIRGTGDFQVTATATDPYITGPIDPVTSGQFSVVANSAGILLYARSTLVNAGGSADLVAKLVGVTSATAFQTITFEEQVSGSIDWVTVGTALTDGTGNAMITTTPRYDTTFRATAAATATLAAATSNLVPVGVRPAVKVSPADGATVAVGKDATYSVMVSPAPLASEAPTMVTLLVYEKVNGAWVYQGEKAADVTADGTASVTWTWATAGTWAYSVRADASQSSRQGFTAAPVVLTVQ